MSKKTVSYAVAGVLCVYALVYKIPIPCFGCQKEGFWYRCVMETGEGTPSCEAHKQVERRIATAGSIMSNAGVYMDNLWDFTKTELPGVIEDFIVMLKDQILGLKDRMAVKIGQIIAFLRDKTMLFVSKIKDVVVDAYEKFMEIVINPIIQFFVQNLLQPVLNVFKKIMEFRELVWKQLSNAIDKFANIPIGDFVGDVVDIFQKIPEAMQAIKPFIVNLINTVKNKTIGVVNTGIRESIQGVETSVNFLSGQIDEGVNKAIGGLNLVKDELVSNLNTSINATSSGIERMVNSTTGLIETTVNKSVGGVTKGINSSLNNVEKGVNKMIDNTNVVIGGAEAAVGSVTSQLNKVMNGLEKSINTVTNGVSKGINAVLSPVNQVIGLMGKIRTAGVRYKKSFVKIEIKPFEKIIPRNIKKVGGFTPKRVEIPDVKQQKFPRIKDKVDIPDIKFKEIDIPTLDIPEVDIKPPKDINKIDIPDINIPVAKIPVPPDLEEDDLSFPSIPGLGFIGDKVSQIKRSIINIFENAMEPLYEGVATLVALVGSIISSAAHFFQNYLTWTALKSRVWQLIKLKRQAQQMLIDLIRKEIIPGFIRLIKTIADPILGFVKTVTEQAWKGMKRLGHSVGKVFNEAFKAIVKVTGAIAKGVFHTGLYVFGTTMEKYTGFIPLPLSVKLVLIIISLLYMFFGGFVRNAKTLVDVAIGAVHGSAVALTDLDYMLDSLFGLTRAAAAVASSPEASSFLF